MKFSIQTPQKRAPRLGLLKNIESKPASVELETPFALLHTQGGHIPHITHEVFKFVSKSPQVLQIPLASSHNFQESMTYYDGNISEFIGSKNALTCLTLHDPSVQTQDGYHTKDKTPLWTKQGKVLVDADTFMNFVEAFKPDMYCLLSDADTNRNSSQKRISKAVDQTLSFGKQCLERHEKSDFLKKMFVIAPVAGGYCLKSRERCIQALLNYTSDVQGFLIEGLHNNGPNVEFMSFEAVREVLDFVIKGLPTDKLYSVQGCWSPLNVIKLVQLGVDMFDTSYCHVLTERSSAMTFAIDETEQSDECLIHLGESKYRDDFTPISSSCDCLSCAKYSRAYIHHLLTVQELLAPVLIMIHNVHHYLRFFKRIRQCILSESLTGFEQSISKQFENYKDVHKQNTEASRTINLGRTLGDT